MLVCDWTEYICMTWDIIYMTFEDIYMRSKLWGGIELTFVGCEVGFITCFYLKFAYRNFAIDCIVELIKLLYYRDFCS